MIGGRRITNFSCADDSIVNGEEDEADVLEERAIHPLQLDLYSRSWK